MKKSTKVLLTVGSGIAVLATITCLFIGGIRSCDKAETPELDFEETTTAQITDAEEILAGTNYASDNNNVKLSSTYSNLLSSLTTKLRSHCSENRKALQYIDAKSIYNVEINGSKVSVEGTFKNGEAQTANSSGIYKVVLENTNQDLSISKYQEGAQIKSDELLGSLNEMISHKSTTVKEFKASSKIIDFDKIDTSLVIQKAINNLTDNSQIENLSNNDIEKVFTSEIKSCNFSQEDNLWYYETVVSIITSDFTYSIDMTFTNPKQLTGSALSNKATEVASSNSSECVVTCNPTSELNKAALNFNNSTSSLSSNNYQELSK